jgi:hypothetical protein
MGTVGAPKEDTERRRRNEDKLRAREVYQILVAEPF